MTTSPSSEDTAFAETRDWAVASVASFLHGNTEDQDLFMRDCPVMGPEALAMMCAHMIEVLAEMEGRSPESAMQEFALRLQRLPSS